MMGRRGGYGKTGFFAQRMMLDVWYGIEQVKAFFAQTPEAPNITNVQAKLIIDALTNSKCYNVERHTSAFKVKLLSRLEPPAQVESEVVAALKVPNSKQFFQTLLVSKSWDEMTKQRKVTLDKSDPMLKQVSGAKDNKSAIKIGDGLYRLVAWNKSMTEPRKYDLQLQILTEQQAEALTGPLVCLDLS